MLEMSVSAGIVAVVVGGLEVFNIQLVPPVTVRPPEMVTTGDTITTLLDPFKYAVMLVKRNPVMLDEYGAIVIPPALIVDDPPMRVVSPATIIGLYVLSVATINQPAELVYPVILVFITTGGVLKDDELNVFCPVNGLFAASIATPVKGVGFAAK